MRQTDREKEGRNSFTERIIKEIRNRKNSSQKNILIKHCYSKHFLTSKPRTITKQITAVTFRTLETLDSAAAKIYLNCLTSPIQLHNLSYDSIILGRRNNRRGEGTRGEREEKEERTKRGK